MEKKAVGKTVILFLLLSVILLSSCEVFETLYGTNETGVKPGEIIFKPDNGSSDGEGDDEAADEQEVKIGDGKGAPSVITVEETGLVRLKPKAEDLDNDELIFTYTTPLNENGEWQTVFGDAGEYTVTVTVSDGKATDSQDVLIIVNKNEEPPVIIESVPEDTAVEVDETESVLFSVNAEDMNEDALIYEWKLDGVVVADKDSFEYESGYDDSGSHTVKLEVSDGTLSVNKIWAVTVNNINRKPILEELAGITIKETDVAIIVAYASDDDGDELEFFIDDSRFEHVEDNEFEWKTDYDSEGEYKVTVSVTDGTDTVEGETTVIVENLNRGPKLIGFEQK